MLVLSGRQSVEYSSAVMGAQRVRLDNVESHWIKHDGRDPVVYDLVFFFSSRRRHTRCLSDWSSDVCSSDLGIETEELTLPFAIKFVGNKPFLYSSDFPHEVTHESCKHDLAELMESAEISAEDKAGMLWRNAETFRSEERRVGKECRSRWSPY